MTRLTAPIAPSARQPSLVRHFAPSPSLADRLAGQLAASFAGLQGTIRDLEMMAKGEMNMGKRDEYKEKLRLLHADLVTYKQKLDQLRTRLQEQVR